MEVEREREREGGGSHNKKEVGPVKCGEVLDGGLLSRDPCDFKERLAHLVNQRLMRITVTRPPSPLHHPKPHLLLHFVIFHRRFPGR